MPNILVCEDDKSLNNLISTVLRNDGHNVIAAFDGREALMQFDCAHIDMLVSDIMMPEIDGYELLESLRSVNNNLPVLFITAKGTFSDKSKGFNLGADDYMVKPIDIKELVLRVNALLRRSKISNERRIVIGSTVLDSDAYTVTEADGASVTLPQKEFLLLFKLLSYPDRVFTRFEIMDEIWGYESESDEKTINVHISKLRSRYENNPDFSIETVRGIGYKAVIK
ncbi:MAG: response regulator transcription factor [Clostridia bacterium]|nr:response regulator transcription factor [Clostridia bacterium]